MIAVLMAVATFALARHGETSSNGAARPEGLLAGTTRSTADGIRVDFVNHVPVGLASSSDGSADAWIAITNTTARGMRIAYQPDQSVDLEVSTESGTPVKVKSGRHGVSEVRTRTYIAPGEHDYIPIRLKNWLEDSAPALYYVKASLRVVISDTEGTFRHKFVFATDRLPVHFQ